MDQPLPVPTRPPYGRPTRPRRRGAIALCSLAVIAAAVLILSWGARRFVDGHDGLVCVVTTESLENSGNYYDGGDHPLDPAVGDEYLGTSGCNLGERNCVRKVELFGRRTEC